jgi:hypothetical protein
MEKVYGREKRHRKGIVLVGRLGEQESVGGGYGQSRAVLEFELRASHLLGRCSAT